MKKALITGIAGQDGSYLADLLLAKGYQVEGIDLPDVVPGNFARIENRIILHRGSLLDNDWLKRVVTDAAPDECYHLAASSFVSHHFRDEVETLENNILGTHNLLAVLKEKVPPCRFFFAGTSEMFGTAEHSPQDETTPFRPRSVYGISKVAGHHLVEYYRQAHGTYACTGILYNHESPRRGPSFVTRKITTAVARIHCGLDKKLVLGNLDSERDWGYAPDYVQGMWLMLQAEAPRDYVLSSGTMHTVREFVELAFSELGLDFNRYVVTSSEFYRDKEKVPMCGNARRIHENLGWKPSKPFHDIVREMVRSDLAYFKTAVKL